MLNNKHFLLGLSKVLEIKNSKNSYGNDNIKNWEVQFAELHDKNDPKINQKIEDIETQRNTEQAFLKKNVNPKAEVEKENETELFEASLSSIVIEHQSICTDACDLRKILQNNLLNTSSNLQSFDSREFQLDTNFHSNLQNYAVNFSARNNNRNDFCRKKIEKDKDLPQKNDKRIILEGKENEKIEKIHCHKKNKASLSKNILLNQNFLMETPINLKKNSKFEGCFT